MSGHFAPGDQKPSFVAVFILYLIWWLTFIPLAFYSYGRVEPDEIADSTIGSTNVIGIEGAESKVKLSRAHKAYNRARDGVLLLTIAVLISFAGMGDEATTTVLSYIFMTLWIAVVLLSYWTDSKKMFVALEFFGIALLVALIIVVWCTSAGRFLIR